MGIMDWGPKPRQNWDLDPELGPGTGTLNQDPLPGLGSWTGTLKLGQGPGTGTLNQDPAPGPSILNWDPGP